MDWNSKDPSALTLAVTAGWSVSKDCSTMVAADSAVKPTTLPETLTPPATPAGEGFCNSSIKAINSGITAGSYYNRCKPIATFCPGSVEIVVIGATAVDSAKI